MGLRGRPGEDPNAWKQFGPEPHANSFVIGPAVIKHTPYSRIGGGGVVIKNPEHRGTLFGPSKFDSVRATGQIDLS